MPHTHIHLQVPVTRMANDKAKENVENNAVSEIRKKRVKQYFHLVLKH